jgi:hypothetical protein
MTVHLLHIGKTGGTAIKSALRGARLAYFKEDDPDEFPQTPYGGIRLHDHGFFLEHVPPGDHAIFFVRDPISRMISGFQSRLNRGQPRYYSEWSPGERRTFEAFPTPQRLAHALLSDDPDQRALAQRSMRHIKHLRFMQRFTGPPQYVRARLDQILYIGRQETLDTDWRQIKRLLKLPSNLELPTDPVRAHRRPPHDRPQLDAVAVAALRDWYARDYRLVEYCEEVRAERGWGTHVRFPSLDWLRLRAGVGPHSDHRLGRR